MLRILTLTVLLLAVILPLSACNTPSKGAVPAAQRIESANYTQAMGKVQSAAERLDQLITSRSWEPAKYEALVLMNLVDRLRQHTPTSGVVTGSDYQEFLGRAVDLYSSANHISHFTNLRRVEDALDHMEYFIGRYNYISSKYGPGGQIRKLGRIASVVSR